MHTTNTHPLRRAIVATLVLAALSSCSSGNNGATGERVVQQLDNLAVTDLTGDEVSGLQQMREEEKLARDVYVALGEQWDLQIFHNISASEQSHMDAVGALLERHDLTDPAAGKAAGEFVNTELQTLYDDLVARGLASETEALKVGIAIEMLDIADLQAHATDTADIALVYSHLEAGSENHLAAFSRQLG